MNATTVVCRCGAEMVRQWQGAVVIGPDIGEQAMVCMICDRAPEPKP